MQRRLFHIELPLEPGWDSIEPLRASVLACARAVFAEPALAPAIALVTAELLENAVKYGRWDAAGGAVFGVRLYGRGDRIQIEVSSPVADADENVERLRAELGRIAAAPSPEQAYTKAVRAVALGKPAPLGLARIAYEGGCDLSVEVEGNVLHVRATTRELEPARPTPAAPA
jgi:two-component sensor histidine kinase